jgi:phosphatidylglycerophosphate synthase
MLDPLLRRLIDPPLARAGTWLAGCGLTANQATLGGLALGLTCVPLLAVGFYDVALLVVMLNRLLDGVDGAIVRRQGEVTPFGGYLDIVCDMVFYAAVPLGFAFAAQGNAPWAALLLASFICTGASFLGRAIMAAQRREDDDGARGRKSFLHSAGLIEGTETVAAFVLFCLFPASFPWLAGIFALLCFWTAAQRVVEAYRIEMRWKS